MLPPTPTPLSLPDDEAHLFFVRHSEAVDPRRLAALRALLDDEERRRADRFVFARDQRSFVVSHALVRSVLSRYAAVRPEEWSFAVGAYGRPRVAAPALPLDFNLSHTDGLAVCLIAGGMTLGVDVESITRRAPLDVAERWFAPDELGGLKRLPAPAQPRRFFELWTLKEAYIKARGLGLALPLDRFDFDLDGRAAGEPPRVRFMPPIADEPRGWQFELHELQHHLVAVALRRPAWPEKPEKAAKPVRVVISDMSWLVD